MEKQLGPTRQSARIEDWYLAGDSLFGVVSGHPMIPDGTLVRTSKILKFDQATNHAATSNTDYVLGRPNNRQLTN